mgnify:CR=1 FL=1
MILQKNIEAELVRIEIESKFQSREIIQHHIDQRNDRHDHQHLVFVDGVNLPFFDQ